MVTVQGNELGCSFNYLYQPGPHVEPVFLLAGNLAGVAAHAILTHDQQCNSVHPSSPYSSWQGDMEHSKTLRFVEPIAGSYPAGSLSVSTLTFDTSQP